MIQVGELGVEFKSGVLFAIFSLVFSILAGFAGGVPLIMILIRALIITPVFFIVGYAIVLVIKKFVPEVYEAISNLKGSPEDAAEKVEISFDSADSAYPSDSNESPGYPVDEGSVKPDSGFSEFTEKDYERLQTVKDSDRIQTVKDYDKMQTVNDSGLDSVLHNSGGKLGKHLIVENQLNSYEPKIIAQALRTMMSKDKD